jgi:hypothetical protein
MVIDAQFMDQMGSLTFWLTVSAGRWRTHDNGGPARRNLAGLGSNSGLGRAMAGAGNTRPFQVRVDEQPLAVEFGTEGRGLALAGWRLHCAAGRKNNHRVA